MEEHTGSSHVPVKKWNICGSKRKTAILACICMYWFTASCINSMLAPFFPAVALKKGSTNSINGLVLATFPFVISLFSPLYGFLLPNIGPKFIILAGQFVEGGFQILFGFLDIMPDGAVFLVFCFIVRGIAALGAAGTATSATLLVSETFPDNISPALAMVQIFNGFGFMAGPPIGGFLYSVGGFKLPFLVFGAIALCGMIPMFFVLPSKKPTVEVEKWNKGALLEAVRIPAVIVAAITISFTSMVIGFFEPSLRAHLEKPFRFNDVEIGAMFLIAPGAYAVCAPGVGYIAEKRDKRYMMIIGSVITALGFYLLGPTPALSSVLHRALWLDITALILIGIGIAPFFLPCLSDMNECARERGMKDDRSTNSSLSSIFTAMNSLGQILGPTVGGILVDHMTFAWASTLFASTVLFWSLFLVVFTYLDRRHLRRKKEKAAREEARKVDSEINGSTSENLQLSIKQDDGEKVPLLSESSLTKETVA